MNYHSYEIDQFWIDQKRRIETRTYWLFKTRRKLRDELEIEKGKSLKAIEKYDNKESHFKEKYYDSEDHSGRLEKRVKAKSEEFEILMNKYSRLMNRYLLATNKYVKESE